MDFQDFIDYVYELLEDDPTNERANLIINAADDLVNYYLEHEDEWREE